MGEAKRRGTFEQRLAEAQARRKAEALAAELAQAEAEAKAATLRPLPQPSRHNLGLTFAMLGALATAFGKPRRPH